MAATTHSLGRAAALALLALALGNLAACGSGTADLKRELDEKLKRPGGRIEPLPDLKPYESFAYDPTGLRSPFQPSVPVLVPGAGGLRPEKQRVHQYLENFSLDTLKMVGTLKLGQNNYGLVQTKDGLVHRVLPGNYIGQNEGKITTITDSRIAVVEIVPDGIGGYMERAASLVISN